MICAHGHIFGGTEGVGSFFHVLRSRTRFRPYQGRRVPFSCFLRPESLSAVPGESGPVFMFCATEIVFGVAKCVGSRFNILRSRTRYQLCRGRQVPFSCFARPDSFSAVPWTSGPVFMFSTPAIVFGGIECVWSLFHVLRAWTHFRRYRGRPIPFSCFALLDSFSAVPWASGPLFMFCAPKLVFGGAECVGSRIHVLRSRTRFRRYRGRQVHFSCFALPYSFSVVPRTSHHFFMFSAPIVYLCFAWPEN
jgi:hypothetical protein